MRVGVQPSGQQIYTSLHAGTPLVFTEHVRPPLRLWDWHGVAIDAFAAGLLANHTTLDDDRAMEVEVAKFGRGWRTMLDAEAAQKVALDAMRSTSLRAQKSKTVNESLAPEPWQLIRTARLPLSERSGGPPASLQRALEKYPSFIQGFEAARAPFIWRTRPFRAQLRRVLQFAFLAQPSLLKVRAKGDRRPQQAAASEAGSERQTPAEYTASHTEHAHTKEGGGEGGEVTPEELKAAQGGKLKAGGYSANHGDPKEEARKGREEARQAKERERRQRKQDQTDRQTDRQTARASGGSTASVARSQRQEGSQPDDTSDESPSLHR